MASSPIDFSSIGGKRVQAPQFDFSSIGGKPVTITPDAAPVTITPDAPTSAWTPVDESTAAWKPVEEPAGLHLPSDMSISARPQSTGWRDSVARWADDVSNDLKYGTGATAIGRVMKALGAKGLVSGQPEAVAEYMGSPVLGSLQAVKGAAEITQKPWQGTKDIVGGALTAAEIPASFMGGPAAETGGSLATRVLSKAEPAADAWRKINSVLGVTAKGVRINIDTARLESAATMPGRALANLGFTAEQLQKMTPLERMQAIVPHWRDAGRAIDEAVGAATHSGTTLDVGNAATKVLASIKNPQLQQEALDGFNSLVKELDILNQGGATPEEALRLRRALQAGARFGPNGDLNSLGGIRAQLYGAVSGNLKSAVQGLEQLDQHYSDLKGAMNATQGAVRKFATQPPAPSATEKAIEFGKKTVLPWAIRGAIGGSAAALGGKYALRSLSDLLP